MIKPRSISVVLCSRCRGQINNRPIKIDRSASGTYSYAFFDPGHRQNAKFHISVIKVRIAVSRRKKKKKGKKGKKRRVLTFANRKHVSLETRKGPIVNDEGFSFGTDNRSAGGGPLWGSARERNSWKRKEFLIVARALEGTYYGNCFAHRNHYV